MGCDNCDATELAWSNGVAPSEKRCPAGSAKGPCCNVVSQLHPFLRQLVNIGGPAKS